jgi:hypothetical protein
VSPYPDQRLFPQLGSGPGSRGYAALYKNRLVKTAIKQFDISSIVDIGCGDLCWLDWEILTSCSYVGLDISTVAIERATAAYPSLLFAVYDVTGHPLDIKCDLVVSFDVLIHQTDAHLFYVALGNLLAAIGKVGLVSYITPPLPDGSFPPPATLDPALADAPAGQAERTFCRMIARLSDNLPRAETGFHQPLPIAVTARRGDLDVSVVGHYRHQTIYAIQAKCGGSTFRQAPAAFPLRAQRYRQTSCSAIPPGSYLAKQQATGFGHFASCNGKPMRHKPAPTTQLYDERSMRVCRRGQ